MPELTDEQIDKALFAPPEKGKFDPVTQPDGSLSDSAIDAALNSPPDKPFSPKDQVVEKELDPIARQFQIRFNQSKKDWRDNNMWFGALTGMVDKSVVRDRYGTTENDKAINQEIKTFNDENEVYAIRNLLHPTYAGMDLAQSSPQMGVSLMGSLYGGAAGGAAAGLTIAATGGLAAPVVVPLIPAFVATGAFMGSYVPNTIQFIGANYKKYTEAGVDDATAKRMAISGGLIQGLGETFGDLIVKGVLTKKAAKVIIRSEQGKMLIKETLGRLFQETGMLAGKSIVEGGTEGFEDIVGYATDSFTKQWSEPGFDPSFVPSFSEFMNDLGKSFVAGTRAGGASLTGAKTANVAWRLGTQPKNMKEAFDERRAEIEAQVKERMRLHEETKFEKELSAKRLEGNVALNEDPKDALKNAEFALDDLKLKEDDYLAKGEEVPDQLMDAIKQGIADLKAAENRYQEYLDNERLNKFKDTKDSLEKAANQTGVAEDERSELLDKAVKVGKELREIQSGIIERKAERRLDAIDKEIAKAGGAMDEFKADRVKDINDEIDFENYKFLEEEAAVEAEMQKQVKEINKKLDEQKKQLTIVTKVAIRNLTDKIVQLQAEIAKRNETGKGSTIQLEKDLAKAIDLRERTARAINKNGNLTKVAPDSVKKVYNAIVKLQQQKETIQNNEHPQQKKIQEKAEKLKAKIEKLTERKAQLENETSPEYEKLFDKIEKLNEERAYLDLVLETIKLGGMTSEDFDSFLAAIPNRSAKRLANSAVKYVIQGYAQGKHDAKKLSKLRKAWDTLIRLAEVDTAVKAKFPKSSSITFANVGAKLNEIIARIEKAQADAEMKEAVAKLDKALARSEVSGRDKTKVGPEAQQVLDWFRRLRNGDDKIKAPEGDEALLEAVKERFSELDNENADSINAFVDFINDITTHGIGAWDNVLVRNKAEANVIVEMVMKAIQGKRPIDPEEGSLNHKVDKEKTGKAFGFGNLDWTGNLANIFQDTKKSERDPLIDVLDVAPEVSRETTLLREWGQKLQEILQKASNLNGWDLFWRMVASNTNDKKKWISFTYRPFSSIKGEGLDRLKVVTKQLKPGHALQAWMYLQTPSLKEDLNEENDMTTRQDMIDAGLDPEDSTEAALERALDDYDHTEYKDHNHTSIKLGRALMEFYDSLFPLLAETYKAVYGREFTKDKLYAGFVRRRGTTAANIGEQYQNFIDSIGRQTNKFAKRSVTSSSTYERQQDTGRAIQFENAFLNTYFKMGMDIHFAVWHKKAELLSRVFFDPKVQELIAAKFGTKMNVVLRQMIDDMTQGYVERAWTWSEQLNTTIGNLSIQKLGGWKPEQLVKQFTGIYLAAIEMGPRNFFMYLDQFLMNPKIKDAVAKIQNSDWYKDRFTKGAANQKGEIASGDALFQAAKDKLENLALWFMITGDKGNAVVLGDMMTNFYKDQGFTEEEALIKAGLFVNRTQSTNRIDMMSQFQRDKRWKIFTMFQNQQNLMFQYQVLAAKEFINHPSLESAKVLINTELTIRLANIMFEIAGSATRMLTTGEASEDDMDQLLWNISFMFWVPPLPSVFSSMLKPLAARATNEIRGLTGDKRRIDAFAYNTPVISLLSEDLPRVATIFGKALKAKNDTDLAISMIDLLMTANRLAALTPFGFIPADHTLKGVKRELKKGDKK